MTSRSELKEFLCVEGVLLLIKGVIMGGLAEVGRNWEELAGWALRVSTAVSQILCFWTVGYVQKVGV